MTEEQEKTITFGAPAPDVDLDDEAPKLTPRMSLKEQRQRILDTLYLDLRVPRWPNEIYVRYAPIKSAKVDQSIKRRSASEHEADDASLLVHADMLISACQGVFQILDGDFSRKYALRLDPDTDELEAEPTEHFTKFDKDLGRALGLADWQLGLATNICRALYLTDGDLIDASSRLSSWSAAANEKAEEDFTNL